MMGAAEIAGLNTEDRHFIDQKESSNTALGLFGVEGEHNSGDRGYSR